MYYIYPDIYYFYIALPSFLMFQYISSSIISLLSKKLPLAVFCFGLLTTGSSSDSVFLPLSFLNDMFIGYRILCWQFFSFSTLKMLCHFFLTSIHGFWWEICNHLNCCVSISSALFFGILSRFLFCVLVFSSCLWCAAAWISLWLSYLGFTELFESENVGLLSDLGCFQPLFLQIFFLYHTLFSFSESADIGVRPFCIIL